MATPLLYDNTRNVLADRSGVLAGVLQMNDLPHSLATIQQDPLARRNFVQLKVGSTEAPFAREGCYLMTGEEAAASSDKTFDKRPATRAPR